MSDVVRSADSAVAVAVTFVWLGMIGAISFLEARRSDEVLAGVNVPRSRAHYAYVDLEVAKAIALAVGGILELTG